MRIDCAFDELVPLEKLVPHPRNTNRHSIEQINALAKLINAHGFRYPIVVSKRSGFIVSGHGRLDALKVLKEETAPVDYQDFSSEAEEFQVLTSDNEIARWAELDYQEVYKALNEIEGIDSALLGIEDFKLPEVEVIGETDPDEVPEVSNPITKRGDIWILGNHRLMCGDSTMIDDVEKLMNGEKADMVFTDPPYGVNYDGGHATEKRREKLKNDDDVNMYDLPIKNAFIFSTDKSCLYLWFADRFASDVIKGVSDAGYQIRSWIIWNKNVAQFGAIGAQYKSKHEPCIYAFKSGKTVNWCGPNNETTVWDIKRESKNEFHPTQKPVALSERAFNNHSVSKVLDLFGGSGSTLISAEKNNKNSFIMELSESYCDVIINRWQNFTKKDAILESTGQKYNELKVN